MSEPIVTDPAPTPAATDPAPAQDTDWKAEARKWEQRAKDNKRQLDEAAPKISEYDRLIEASKSETQRLQEQHAAAARRAELAEAEALRLRIATRHGLAEDDLDLLGSGDVQALTARAQRLADQKRRIAELEAAASAGKPAVPSTRPQPLLPGASPTPVQSEEDAVYAALFGAS